MNQPSVTDRLARAAERLRLHGLDAEERGHTSLANLCWRKRIEALSALTLDAAAENARRHRRITKAESQYGRLS